MVLLRPFAVNDVDALWSILEPTFRAGDTYTIDPQVSREDAVAYWTGSGREVWMAADGEKALGTYYIRPNQGGGGAHVCNCGYVTHPRARGRGIARSMLEHSLQRATELGFSAMQFSFVVATNSRAISTWKRAGFKIVGRLPKAFRHPDGELVDALVMHRDL